jgi:AcrR family transcriptional regulator
MGTQVIGDHTRNGYSRTVSQDPSKHGQNAELRKTLHASKDPRVVRTRAAIVDAVHRLADEGRTTISVADIVRAAGISQSSFYSHFASLDELASYIFGLASGDFATSDAEATRWERLVRHYEDQRALYSACLALPITLHSHNESAADLGQQIVDRVDPETVPDGVDLRLSALVAAGGAIGLLTLWLTGQVEGSADDMIRAIESTVPAWLH